VRVETFPTPGPVLLTVRIPAGEIRLETADEPETHVELDGDEDALAETRIELRRRGDGHEVVVETERRFRLFGWRDGDYRLLIRAPHGADIDLETGSADVDGVGRFGSVELQVASGEVEFEEIAGGAEISIASGDVRVESVGGEATIESASGDVELGSLEGRGKIRSASGDVSVEEAASSIAVQTASGDQEIGSIAAGQVTLQSASGNIAVGVARGATLWIDAKSMSGETTSELEIGEQPPEEGAAKVELRATSMSGDISIRRA
jgi:hypothetical protein